MGTLYHQANQIRIEYLTYGYCFVEVSEGVSEFSPVYCVVGLFHQGLETWAGLHSEGVWSG